jgi:hypothetical protein
MTYPYEQHFGQIGDEAEPFPPRPTYNVLDKIREQQAARAASTLATARAFVVEVLALPVFSATAQCASCGHDGQARMQRCDGPRGSHPLMTYDDAPEVEDTARRSRTPEARFEACRKVHGTPHMHRTCRRCGHTWIERTEQTLASATKIVRSACSQDSKLLCEADRETLS